MEPRENDPEEIDPEEIDPGRLTPGELYGWLSNHLVPRPIAFVSTESPAGVRNLSPFSFFALGGSNPGSIVFSPTLSRDGVAKDTLRNIEATGDYTINFVDRSMAAGMNETAARFGPDESEWPASGFTPAPSHLVRPPTVRESAASLECRLFQIVRHGSQMGSAVYVIGEVVWITHRHGTPLIARLGGPDYLDLADGSRFSLERPALPNRP